MANPTPSPEAGRDFPDTPPENRDSVGGDLSEQQLADMADRMGLSGASSSEQTPSRPWWAGGITAVILAGAALLILRRRRS